MPNTPLTLRAEPQTHRDFTCHTLTLRAETINAESRTVEAVLATDSAVAVFDFRRFEVIDEVLVMRGMKPPTQMPLLANHARFGIEDVLGSIRDMRKEGNQLIGRLHFATGPEESPEERAWEKVRQGHLTDVSIGYRSINFVDIPAGESQTINGKRYTAGVRTLRITTESRPHEGSITPIGADQAAKIRRDLGFDFGERTMNKQLRSYLESVGLRSDASEEEAQTFRAALNQDQQTSADGIIAGTIQFPEQPPADPSDPPAQRTQPPVDPPAADPPVVPTNPPAQRAAETDPEAVRLTAIQEERQRATQIRSLAGDDVPEEIVTRAITEGWDESRASREFLTAIRSARSEPIGGAPFQHSRGHEQDCTAMALASAMMMRSGLDPVGNHVSIRDGIFQPGVRVQQDQLEQAAERGHHFRHMSLIDVCRESCRLDGSRVSLYDQPAMLRAAVSGSTLTGIFTTNFSAMLIASYMVLLDTTEGWTRSTDVPNFQTNERTQMGKMGALKRHGRGGVAHDMEYDDQTESYKIARYSGKFSVDEMDIIDDRFGAIQQTSPQEMGEAAAQLRPDLVFSILLNNPDMRDGVALFHEATHGNTRGTAGLALATLEAAINALNTQTDRGKPLNKAQEVRLITPEALSFKADQLVNSSEIRESVAADGTRNPIRSRRIIPVSDSRLDNGVTDPVTETVLAGSATTWYLSRPGDRHTIEVGHLRGRGRRPQIRSFTLSEGQWGIGWDVNMDIGAKALDWKGLDRNEA